MYPPVELEKGLSPLARPHGGKRVLVNGTSERRVGALMAKLADDESSYPAVRVPRGRQTMLPLFA